MRRDPFISFIYKAVVPGHPCSEVSFGILWRMAGHLDVNLLPVPGADNLVDRMYSVL